MAKCAGCGKFLKPAGGAASCTTCSCVFHTGCVAIPDITAIPKDWICPECKKKQRKGDNTNTPIKGVCVVPLGQDTTVVSGSSSENGVKTVPGVSLLGDADVKELRREFSEYIAETREFRNEFRAAIAAMGQRMDGFERRLELIELKEVPPGSTEVSVLQKAVVQLKDELNDRDQDALLSDLEIGHYPEEKGENVVHAVTISAAKLGVSLDHRDIVYAERLGALDWNRTSGGASGEVGAGVRSRSRRIVVRLTRRSLRDDILQAARVRRSLSTAEIGLAGPPLRLYVNERLTKTNRLLFYRVREECRKRQWRYSWTKRGRIFVRQSDGKQVHTVRSEADISRVFEASTV